MFPVVFPAAGLVCRVLYISECWREYKFSGNKLKLVQETSAVKTTQG